MQSGVEGCQVKNFLHFENLYYLKKYKRAASLSSQTVFNSLASLSLGLNNVILGSVVAENIGLVERILGGLLEILVNNLLQLSLTQTWVFSFDVGHLSFGVCSQCSLEASFRMLFHFLILGTSN
jgi:hypothetical protein